MTELIKDCAGIILAGGENSRMPVLKAFMEVKGQKIIERNLRIIKKLFIEVYVVTNQPETYSHLAVPMLGDTYNTRGPMTGIFTSLLNARSPWVFITACDMPFITDRLITYMASKRDQVDAVVPVSPAVPQNGIPVESIEPLFALYSKKLVLSMEKAILRGRKSLRDFLSTKRVKYITNKEIIKIEPNESIFINLNSPEDVDLHLPRKDKIRFKRKVERRGKCLV
jgi:molybdopterin-guanine dinucleotide biosynthesis protein A